ncbi:hypothetical protein FKM82_018520 [Ascaphus truei]
MADPNTRRKIEPPLIHNGSNKEGIQHRRQRRQRSLSPPFFLFFPLLANLFDPRVRVKGVSRLSMSKNKKTCIRQDISVYLYNCMLYECLIKKN